MDVTAKNLTAFQQWLVRRGRMADTAALYVRNVRRCSAEPEGMTARLLGTALAPNTMRSNLASLRAWALFSDDRGLARELADIRMPPARRVRAKPPLSRDDWHRSIKHLQTAELDEPVRCVLLIMALRGMRSGDVMRIKRAEVVSALASGKLAYEGKGRKRIEFSATPIRAPLEALAAIRGWDVVRDLITSSKDVKVASNRIRRASQRVAGQIGIMKMNPHRYRHTFATCFLAELKGDPNALLKLQQHMAWESMATAARYVGATAQDELDAVGDRLVSGLLE